METRRDLEIQEEEKQTFEVIAKPRPFVRRPATGMSKASDSMKCLGLLQELFKTAPSAELATSTVVLMEQFAADVLERVRGLHMVITKESE